MWQLFNTGLFYCCYISLYDLLSTMCTHYFDSPKKNDKIEPKLSVFKILRFCVQIPHSSHSHIERWLGSAKVWALTTRPLRDCRIVSVEAPESGTKVFRGWDLWSLGFYEGTMEVVYTKYSVQRQNFVKRPLGLRTTMTPQGPCETRRHFHQWRHQKGEPSRGAGGNRLPRYPETTKRTERSCRGKNRRRRKKDRKKGFGISTVVRARSGRHRPEGYNRRWGVMKGTYCTTLCGWTRSTWEIHWFRLDQRVLYNVCMCVCMYNM